MAIQFHCPSCRAVLRVGDEQANTKVLCPTCQQKLLVPTPQLPPAKKTVLGVLDPPPAPPPVVVSPPPPQEKVIELSRAKREVELDDPEPYFDRQPVINPAERLAQTALIFAIISIVIFGFPLGIIAAVLATVSLTMPNRSGNGTAIAALVIGVIAAFLHAFIMLVFFTAPLPRH